MSAPEGVPGTQLVLCDTTGAPLVTETASPRTPTVGYRDPLVLYEVPLGALTITVGDGFSIDVSDTLSNGRSNYVLVQRLAALFAGLSANSEGGAADLVADDGSTFEVKAYCDHELHPGVSRSVRDIHTAASSTFGPNNKGPEIAALLADGDYDSAFALCRATGFSKADHYLYTNTRRFEPGVPLRYLVVPTVDMIAMLSRTDPRILPREALLNRVRRVVRLDTPPTVT